MDQNNQEVTIEQLLKISINQLNGIVVPIAFTENIAMPINRVIHNLEVGIEAIEKSKNPPAENDPEIIKMGEDPEEPDNFTIEEEE